MRISWWLSIGSWRLHTAPWRGPSSQTTCRIHQTSVITNPYENILVAFHRLMTAAYSPMTRAEQSNSIWNPSEIRPRLFVHTPYTNSTKVNIYNKTPEISVEQEIIKDCMTKITIGWLVVVERHIQRYFSYIVTGQLSTFQILTCCQTPNAMGSLGSLACRAYPDTGTRMSEDTFHLLAIRGPTRGEGKLGFEPGLSDPQFSPLPLRHHGGHQDYEACMSRSTNTQKLCMFNNW